MRRILFFIVPAFCVFASMALTPGASVQHEWRVMSDKRFFDFVDSILELNDSTPFVVLDPGFRQREQRAKRYYKITVDDGSVTDSIILNDGRPHKIHISQHSFLKYDVKSTVKYKERVYFFTAEKADVFSTLPFGFLLSYSKIYPCLPGQEWEFEYTAIEQHEEKAR